MSQPFAERRKSPRVEADFFLDVRAPESSRSLRVKDISASGVCCQSEVPMPEMARVQMEIHLPGGQRNGSAIHAIGAVVRCQPRRNGAASPGFDVAIFFIEISEDHRAAIARFVRSTLNRRTTS